MFFLDATDRRSIRRPVRPNLPRNPAHRRGHPRKPAALLRRYGWEAETLGFVYTVGDEAIEAIEIFSDPDRALRRARRTPDEVLRGDGLRKDG